MCDRVGPGCQANQTTDGSLIAGRRLAEVDWHHLRVSPATVRNDMAVLEEEGYIRQPHTSAGRVPTDRGYRLFVDKLSRIKPLSPAERRAIERTDERIALAGTANLTRGGILDFQGSIRPILEALEEEVVLLKLIGSAEPDPTVTREIIGDENEIEHLRGTSVVSTGYGPGRTIVGGLGVLGPTRMDYPATIATVSAVARYVGDILARN